MSNPTTSRKDSHTNSLLVVVLLGLALAGITGPRMFSHEDIQTRILRVPGMTTPLQARVATNSVLHQVTASEKEFGNDRANCEIDLDRHRVFYHDGVRLRHADYNRRIVAAIRQIGYPIQMASVRPNPRPAFHQREPYPVWLEPWPDRHTLVLDIPDMTTIRDANIVVDAIAFARAGGDIPHVVPSLATRTITVTFDSMKVDERRLVAAIENVGIRTSPSLFPELSDHPFPTHWRPL